MRYTTDTTSLLARLIKSTDALDMFNCVGNLSSTDIRENMSGCNYYPFARVGECVVIANDDTSIMAGWMKQVCRVVYFGKDLEHGRRIKASAELQGRVLAYTREPLEFATDDEKPEYVGRLIPGGMGFEELANDIAAEIGVMGVKVVLIDDLSTYAKKNDCGQIVRVLNDIARAKDAVILAGFNFAADTTATEKAAPYFANHDRNLCFLIPGEEGGVKYFSFMYGQPERKKVVYALDEKGELCIPARMGKRLILKELLPMLLKEPVKNADFKNILFGAFRGEYVESTIIKTISEAHEWGFIHKEKKAGRVIVSIGDGKTADTSNVALTAKADRYSDREHNGKRVPFITFGGCKVVAVSDCDYFNNGERDRQMLGYAVLGLIESVITGKRLDFKLESKRNNILIIDIAPEAEAERCNKYISDKAERAEYKGQYNFIRVEPGMSDSAFVELLERETDRHRPDFVFVLNLERLDTANLSLLADDLRNYSKRKDIACIAQLYHYTTPEDGLTDEETLCLVCTMYDDTFEDVKKEAGKHHTPNVYEFMASTKGRIIICRYVSIYNGFMLANSETIRRAVTIGHLRFCRNYPIDNIHAVNEATIKWAAANGLITITGKKPNALVTFNA